jgi:serine/threonine protein kinase/tetratricopeptide (TPR) repeat protein
MPLAIGTRLGPYEIQAPAGTGGMGEVYRARDTRLERIVAIKILSDHLSSDPEVQQRFQREARTISSLNHPHICQLFDVGAHDGASFLVMEFLEGETLAERLLKGPLPLDQCLKVGIEVAEGLEKAHRSGVIHRDLKPANIFLTQDGPTKLLDFGLAKSGVDLSAVKIATAARDPELDLTIPGSTMGTVPYMSPEQARGESLSARSDLFSLGIVLYEMTTGQRPFNGTTVAMIFDSILHHEPPPLFESGFSHGYSGAVSRLMAKSPHDRCESAHELVERLREIQHSLQSSGNGKSRTGRKIPSIAVLPFANLSAEPDNQYFSDGLSEDLISALARLQGLQVASRTSAFRFRGETTDIREIGRQLKVEALLEGSVRRSGKRLRVTAQLVNVADGYHLWSERYDREINDVFEIQDEITAAIIKTLEPTLAGQQQALTRRHSENVQAYELYLKGRRLWDQRAESSLRAGLECFRAALELDPDYALAYAGVADSFSILTAYGHMSVAEAKQRVEAAVRKSLELDATLAEPHFSMALSATIFARDSGPAERHYRKALEIEPNSSATLAYFSLFLATRHRYDEVPPVVSKAIEADPLSSFVRGLTGLSLQCARMHHQAMENARQAIELQPNSVLGLWTLQIAFCSLGQWDQAIELGETLVSVSRRSGLFMGHLGLAYGLAGQSEKGLALLRELHQRQQVGEYFNPAHFMLIHFGLGDYEGIYASLLTYLQESGNSWGLEIIFGSFLDQIAAHSSCAELLRQLGRPD